jgi:class 3 adenylate cyclase
LFLLVNIIGKNGGDIFKFAGDAILVIWPENKDLRESCRRAIQCALDIQSKLNNQEITPNKKLSVKIGIGVGECRILVVGGQFRRCEYLSVGEALRQACESETKATEGGQTICSEDVKTYVNNFFEMEEAKGGDDHGHGSSQDDMKFFKILKSKGERTKIKADAFLMRSRFTSDKLRLKFPILKTFVPAAISLYLDIEKESWSKEIRMLTIMFLNLKVDLSQTKNSEGMNRIQEIVKSVQRSIYRTRGALNKFLMDDKGSVILCCWGLPPLSSADDHVKSVVSALTLIEELKKVKCGAYMGITTGTCFAGVCGTIGNRREYSLLGEVVNLSARYMGKAMKQAHYQNLDYAVFFDEKTKNLIQDKIRYEYVCSDELKGFTGTYHFYSPVEESRFIPTHYDPFPFIRSHKNNPAMLRRPPDDKSDPSHLHLKSLFMLGRVRELDQALSLLNKVFMDKSKEILLIRGVTGSGKSLFIRKVLHEFINSHSDLSLKSLNTVNGKNIINNIGSKLKSNRPPFIFTSFQSPFTINWAFNGFASIFREIYNILRHFLPGIGEFNISKSKQGSFMAKCDLIGKIMFKKNVICYIKYIEEILAAGSNTSVDLSIHFKLQNEDIKKTIRDLPPRDEFFENRKYDDFTKLSLGKFFKSLLKKYKKFINSHYSSGFNAGINKIKIPLILITEDSQFFDSLSIYFLKLLQKVNNEKKLSSTCIIVSYSDPLYPMLKYPNDLMFNTISEMIDITLTNHDISEKTNSNSRTSLSTFVMETIMDKNDLQELLKHHLSEKMLDEYKTSIDRIDPVILSILLSKSFNGVPLFILDIIDNLIDSKKFVQVLSGELIITSELTDMEEMRDWTSFTVPMRIEKIIGNIIDSLTPREIIVLKYASVIGNIFDKEKIEKNNPFDHIASDEINLLLKNLEVKGVVEILYDLKPKKMVLKFGIPFLREILYQRMLIEQKHDIHMNMARHLQSSEFKYMPHSQEVKFLENHMKTTEKTLTKQMEDESDEENMDMTKMVKKKKHQELNLNNLKIFLVKDICERLKVIDLKIETEESNHLQNQINHETFSDVKSLQNFSKKNFQSNLSIKGGYIEKKSDKNITWEYRYVVITNTKVFYFYHEKEFLENKKPLGNFLLKNLYDVEILPDHSINGKKNLFIISVSSWTKKDKIKPHRTFNFSAKSREDLYQWVITLNFLRIKATYDEFSSHFGLINLPLRHDVKKAKKRFRNKYKGPDTILPDSKNTQDQPITRTTSLYNSIARKSIQNSSKSRTYEKNDSMLSRNAYSSLMRRSSMFPLGSSKNLIDENNEKFIKVKKMFSLCMMKGVLAFIGFIQDVIFEVDNISVGQDKVISVPHFLKKYLDNQEGENENYNYYNHEDENYEFNSQNNFNKSKVKFSQENFMNFSVTQAIKESESENEIESEMENSKLKIEKIKFANPALKIHSMPVSHSEPMKKNYSEMKQSIKDEDFLDIEEDEKIFLNDNKKALRSESIKKFEPFKNFKNNINNLKGNSNSPHGVHEKQENKIDDNKFLYNKNVISFNADIEEYNTESINSYQKVPPISVDSNKQDRINTILNSKTSNKIRNENNNIFNPYSNPAVQTVSLGSIPTTQSANTHNLKYSNSNKILLESDDLDAGSLNMLNKLKNFNLSLDDSDEEFVNLSKFKIKENENNLKQENSNFNDLNENYESENQQILNDNLKLSKLVHDMNTRHGSVLQKYTDPKYDFLKNEKSDHIYKNIHSSNIFKKLLKK